MLRRQKTSNTPFEILDFLLIIRLFQIRCVSETAYTVNPEGAAEVEGDTLIQEGEELSFTVKPVDGYVIQIVTANGYELAAEAEEDTEGDSGLAGMATYVVTDIEENLDIEVELLETEETAFDTAAFMAEIDGITILV